VKVDPPSPGVAYLDCPVQAPVGDGAGFGQLASTGRQLTGEPRLADEVRAQLQGGGHVAVGVIPAAGEQLALSEVGKQFELPRLVTIGAGHLQQGAQPVPRPVVVVDALPPDGRHRACQPSWLAGLEGQSPFQQPG
jgi:hypothetical protein